MEKTDLSIEAPRRSLILLACGAIAGLALAGYGLFTAPGSKTSAMPEGAIALVNNRVILLSDYRTQLEALYEVPVDKATAEQRKAVLDSMVTEELLVQRGLEIDLPASEAGVREALVAGVNRTTTLDLEAKKPADADLKAYFTAHPEKYRSTGMMTLHRLVAPVGAEPLAREATQALRKGMRPEKAARRFGLKPSAPQGREELDIAVARVLGDKVYGVAEKLSAGEVSEPIAASDGLHILVMAARRPSVPLEFEAARDRVASDMKRDARRRAQEEYAQFLRSKAESLFAPGYGP